MTLVAHARARSGAGYVQHITVGRHGLIADEPAGHGGTDAGPQPFEFVLAGLAACTSITLRMYAERKGWTLGEVALDLKYLHEDAGDRIERRIEIEGELTDEQRARLLEIAGKTPVTKLLLHGVSISTQLATGARK